MLRIGVVLLLVMVMFGQAIAQNKSHGTVKFIIGKVEILPSKKTTWKKARIKDAVYEGDRIKTAASARIEINMPDGTNLRIDQNTIFDIKEIKTEEEDGEDAMSFSLWAGNMWAKFKKVVAGRKSRRIESPSAVVAIRGTELEVNVDKNLTTKVSVAEGLVAVTSKDAAGEVMVGANQQTTVKKGQAPSKPKGTSGNEQGKNRSGKFNLRVDKMPIQQTDPAVLSSGVTISGKTSSGAKVSILGLPLAVAPNGSFRGMTRVKEGFNSISIVAEKNGEVAKQNVKLFVNTRRPQIKLSSPLVAGFTNKRNYSLSGAVFDETPLDKVKVFYNGNEVAEVRGRGSFNRTVILQEGKNKINIRAIDLAKNSVEMSENIFLDTVKPIITITEPAQVNTIISQPPPHPGGNFLKKKGLRQIIRGVIIDPQPSSKLKRVMINGKEIKPNSDGSFEIEVFLKRGEHRLEIMAEDISGNITRDTKRRIMIR